MQKISHETIKKLVVPLPPLTEQSLIVSCLDASLFTVNETEQKIKAAIDRLKEYRTALITNAVTGAIDVRNVPIPNDLKEAA
jgi:type I restriction enzyme, S subunit